MAFLSTDERDYTKLLINQERAMGPGPGQYDNAVHPSQLYKQKDKKSTKRNKPPPAFGKSVKDGTESTNFSPGPGYYQKEQLFDQQIVAKDQNKGVYFVLQKGALHRKHEWLSADKTRKGLELIDPKKASDPGPGAYSPRNELNNPGLPPKRTTLGEKKRGQIGQTFIHNLKSTGLNLTTVPSIPSKSQLLVVHPQDYMLADPINHLVKVGTDPYKQNYHNHKAQTSPGNKNPLLDISSQLIQDGGKIDESLIDATTAVTSQKGGNQSSMYPPTNQASQSTLTYQGNLIARLAPMKEDGYEKRLGPGSYDPVKPADMVKGAAWGRSKDKRKLWYEGQLENRVKEQLGGRLSEQAGGDPNFETIEDKELVASNEQVQKDKYDIKKALRRAQNMKKRWRNEKGPHTIEGGYSDEDDEDIPIEQQLIRENLAQDRNEVPGPGSYYSYEKFSTLNVKKKDPKHQFFSSTEDRFKHSIFAVDEQITPVRVGPGAYEAGPSVFGQDRRKLKETPAEASEIKRIFDQTPQQMAMPGPGEYRNTDAAYQKKDYQKAFISAFNTSDARLLNAAKFAISPGPGTYNHISLKSPKSKVKSSIFQSSTKRSIEKYFVPDPDLPGASDYNLQHYKGTSFHQLSGGAPNNILVLKRAVQRQQEKVYTLPEANSSSKMIGAINAATEYSNVGPGSYQMHNEFDDMHKKALMMKNKDRMFGVSKRTLFNESAAAAQPGPGQYMKGNSTNGGTSMENNDWYKKTFNYRYLKQYHNGAPIDPYNSPGVQQPSIYEALQANSQAFQPRARSHLTSLHV
ncbi:hypothetical protein FGO68_gene4078 [Halteria grandinella]|uniref:Uncharacterized protein n=1 Tax=Halteria grandinella TaxID=5974 RepID=A0A8J8NW76_HALGN|nr:hypothetical protein FGO68_gene4078 [Halteria grandinella]